MNRLMPLAHSRMKNFGDFIELADFLFINHLPYSEALFEVPGVSKTKVAAIYQAIIWEMDKSENWAGSGMNEASRKVAELFGVNHKKVVMPLLFACIMGKRHGLPLFDSVELLGKDRMRVRLLQSMDFNGGLSSKKTDLVKKAFDSGVMSPAVLAELE